MAEPARNLTAVPAPSAAEPPRRRAMLFADVLPPEPIAPPRPRWLLRLVVGLADAFVPAALLLAAAVLWRVT